MTVRDHEKLVLSEGVASRHVKRMKDKEKLSSLELRHCEKTAAHVQGSLGRKGCGIVLLK